MFARYDPPTNQWTPLPLPPTYHRWPASGVVRGYFYLIGGRTQNGTFSYANEMFDPATNTWTTKRDSPGPRYAAGSAVVDGLLYVVAGYGNQIANSVQIYDHGSDRWMNRAPPAPTARNSLSAVALNGKLYALGGVDGVHALATNEVYTPGNVWVTKAPMPIARGGLVGVASGGKLFAIGGFNGAKLAVNTATTPRPTAGRPWRPRSRFTTNRRRE